jgi:hypothetical protein
VGFLWRPYILAPHPAVCRRTDTRGGDQLCKIFMYACIVKACVCITDYLLHDLHSVTTFMFILKLLFNVTLKLLIKGIEKVLKYCTWKATVERETVFLVTISS